MNKITITYDGNFSLPFEGEQSIVSDNGRESELVQEAINKMEKELFVSPLRLLVEEKTPSKKDACFSPVGQWCLIRSHLAGVHYGKVEDIDGEKITLTNSIRFWRWQSSDGVALSSMAQNGPNLSECKVDAVNPQHFINGYIEIIPVSDKFKESVKNVYK